MSELRIIGKPVPRHDAVEKAFGVTQYAADFSMPGMLHAKVLRSRHPSARIVSIDTSKAQRLSGVMAVLTVKDVPQNESVTRFGQTHAMGGGFEGLYRVLADKMGQFMGEAVALVAAETEEIATRAIELIKVGYEPLPGVFDPLDAMKPDAPQVEVNRSNIITHFEVIKGDVEEGFRQADVIVEHTYRVPFVDHVYMEPESGVAWIDEKGGITIRVCTTVIEHFRGIAD